MTQGTRKRETRVLESVRQAVAAAAMLAFMLGGHSVAHARRVRGECSNAYTGYQHAFVFQGRFNAAAGQLRGVVVGAGKCPHGRLRATCRPENGGRFFDCHGTVGRCQIDGPYYGSFPATYRCPNGAVGAFGWN